MHAATHAPHASRSVRPACIARRDATMSTRSGTNAFHGSAFESLQNDALNATNFFATTPPPIRLNQFGGTFGGPVRQGKTFFFSSWERTGQLTSDVVLSTVPTLANRL